MPLAKCLTDDLLMSEQRVDTATGDEPHGVSGEELLRKLQELARRTDETGETFAVDPETGEAEVIFAPPLGLWRRLKVASGRDPVIHVPARFYSRERPRERRSRSRTRSSARASPDDPDLEPPPIALLRGFPAASERLSRHLQRRTAAGRIA
jgi:hypothetical protein